MLVLSTIYCISELTGTILDASDGNSIAGELPWTALSVFPPALCATVSSALAAVLLLDFSRLWCRRNYDSLCAAAILLLYFAIVFPRAALEAHHAAPGPGRAGWAIDYSAFPPRRVCNDSDPAAALGPAGDGQARAGCNSVLLSGGLSAACLLCNLLPRVCRAAPAHAAAVALLSAAGLVAAALAVGALDWGLLSAAALQLAAGLGAATLCRLRRAAAREEFAAMKGTLFAAEQSRGLLHTLVPRDVLRRLAARDAIAARVGADAAAAGGGGLLCADVRACTVMFCSLEPQVHMSVTTYVRACLRTYARMHVSRCAGVPCHVPLAGGTRALP